MFNLNNFFNLYNNLNKDNSSIEIKTDNMLSINDSVVRQYISEVDKIKDEFIKISKTITRDFIMKNHDVYTTSYFAINKFYNYINKRKYYNEEELDYLYNNVYDSVTNLLSAINTKSVKTNDYEKKINDMLDDIHIEDDNDCDIEMNNKQSEEKQDITKTNTKQIDNDWVIKSTSNYSVSNKIGQLVILTNIENTLFKFTYEFNYDNQFDKYIKKDYQTINQYFEKHNLQSVFNINELSYVQKIENEYEQFNLAFNYLRFMMIQEDDFKEFVNKRPNKINNGIIQVQKFINTMIESFNDNHDFKEVFKHVFINYLNHEFVEKYSMDKILIYYPLDKIKEYYSEPEIWKIENYSFD